jgi:hypothetical protein
MNLKEASNSSERDYKQRGKELEEARTNLRQQQERADVAHKEMLEATNERQMLREQNTTLQSQIGQAKETRENEFQMVYQNVTRVMNNEFGTC